MYLIDIHATMKTFGKTTTVPINPKIFKTRDDQDTTNKKQQFKEQIML